MDVRSLLLERLPDIPRWVEARSALLAGEVEILGLHADGALSAVLRNVDDDTVFAIGAPELGLVREAVARAANGCDLICGLAEADAIAALAAGWVAQPISLHLLAGQGRLPDLNDGDVGWADPSVVEATPLDRELRQELSHAMGYTAIAAAFVARRQCHSAMPER